MPTGRFPEQTVAPSSLALSLAMSSLSQSPALPSGAGPQPVPEPRPPPSSWLYASHSASQLSCSAPVPEPVAPRCVPTPARSTLHMATNSSPMPSCASSALFCTGQASSSITSTDLSEFSFLHSDEMPLSGQQLPAGLGPVNKHDQAPPLSTSAPADLSMACYPSFAAPSSIPSLQMAPSVPDVASQTPTGSTSFPGGQSMAHHSSPTAPSPIPPFQMASLASVAAPQTTPLSTSTPAGLSMACCPSFAAPCPLPPWGMTPFLPAAPAAAPDMSFGPFAFNPTGLPAGQQESHSSPALRSNASTDYPVLSPDPLWDIPPSKPDLGKGEVLPHTPAGRSSDLPTAWPDIWEGFSLAELGTGTAPDLYSSPDQSQVDPKPGAATPVGDYPLGSVGSLPAGQELYPSPAQDRSPAHYLLAQYSSPARRKAESKPKAVGSTPGRILLGALSTTSTASKLYASPALSSGASNPAPRPAEAQDKFIPAPRPTRGRPVPTTIEEMEQRGILRQGQRMYACPHPACRKIFRRAEHLHRHCRSLHNGDRPYPCPYDGCDKKFARHDNLAQHIRVHNKPGNRRRRGQQDAH